MISNKIASEDLDKNFNNGCLRCAFLKAFYAFEEEELARQEISLSKFSN